MNLDSHYWRRHARQPVEFAKGVHTLAELSCALLLEVGPQPVLTAAALREWPDAETRPQAIASLRRDGADHREITEAVASAFVAGHCPDFVEHQQGGAARSTCPPIRSSIAFIGTLINPPLPPNRCHAHRDDPLLETGQVEELATLSAIRTVIARPSAY